MYMENYKLTNEINIAHQQIIDTKAMVPIIVKKTIDEEIAELQEQIMKLYEEKKKNETS